MVHRHIQAARSDIVWGFSSRWPKKRARTAGGFFPLSPFQSSFPFRFRPLLLLLISLAGEETEHWGVPISLKAKNRMLGAAVPIEQCGTPCRSWKHAQNFTDFNFFSTWLSFFSKSSRHVSSKLWQTDWEKQALNKLAIIFFYFLFFASVHLDSRHMMKQKWIKMWRSIDTNLIFAVVLLTIEKPSQIHVEMPAILQVASPRPPEQRHRTQ